MLPEAVAPVAGVPSGQERHGQIGSALHRIPRCSRLYMPSTPNAFASISSGSVVPLASADARLEEDVDQCAAVDESDGGRRPARRQHSERPPRTGRL